MIIKLVDNFYIETDPMNFMLKEKVIGENEKEYHRTISYHTKIERALEHLIEHRVLSDDSELTIDEYIQKCKKLTDEVTNAVKGAVR